MKVKVYTIDREHRYVKGYSVLKAEIDFTTQKRYAKEYDPITEAISIQFLVDELSGNRVIRKVEVVE